MMENRSEYLVTWMALNRLEASPVHTSYGLKPGELEYQVEDSEGSVIVTSDRSVDTARQVRKDHFPSLSLVCVADNPPEDVRDYHSAITNFPNRFPTVEDTGDKTENIVYTSGTTGDPKGASRQLETPDELLQEIGFISEGLGLLEKLPMSTGDRQLIVTPVYHSAGQFLSLIQMVLAGTVYLRPQFEARDTIEKLSEWDINNVFLVATLIRRILDLPESVLDANPTPELKGMMFSAAPFPQPLRERTIERFGAETVHELYGATELGLITHIQGTDMLERPGSVGQPLKGQKVKVMDDDGNELPPNEVGKICVQNEEVMEGYLGREQESEEIKIEGWYTLDDLGYMDEDGYLYLTGRARDMVITGGVNVYPVQIENIIEQHENVKEISVIGVPHDEWGEMLVAYVVPEEDELDVAELEGFARDNLHKAKVPKEWITLDELPRTDTGKIRKKELEERYEENTAQEDEAGVPS
jgi:acyl-CoA synthetase (AMP-forming)/AMP-acid ligase II